MTRIASLDSCACKNGEACLEKLIKEGSARSLEAVNELNENYEKIWATKDGL